MTIQREAPGESTKGALFSFSPQHCGLLKTENPCSPNDWRAGDIHLRLFRWSLFLLLTGTGCASLGHVEERYVACPYDRVWESSLEAVKEFPISAQDKAAGVIETEWIEAPVQNRPYGLFSREGLQEKQRFRTRVALTPRNEVTVIRVSERREHWGFRGGAQIYKWFPVEPSDQAIQEFLRHLTTPLEKQGCLIAS